MGLRVSTSPTTLGHVEASDRQPSAWQRNQERGAALVRVARDLRGFLADVDPADPDAQALLKDARVVEEVGVWLIGSKPIEATKGIRA